MNFSHPGIDFSVASIHATTQVNLVQRSSIVPQLLIAQALAFANCPSLKQSVKATTLTGCLTVAQLNINTNADNIFFIFSPYYMITIAKTTAKVKNYDFGGV
jgi:hypothetical protein